MTIESYFLEPDQRRILIPLIAVTDDVFTESDRRQIAVRIHQQDEGRHKDDKAHDAARCKQHETAPAKHDNPRSPTIFPCQASATQGAVARAPGRGFLVPRVGPKRMWVTLVCSSRETA